MSDALGGSTLKPVGHEGIRVSHMAEFDIHQLTLIYDNAAIIN